MEGWYIESRASLANVSPLQSLFSIKTRIELDSAASASFLIPFIIRSLHLPRLWINETSLIYIFLIMIFPRTALLLAGLVALSNAVSIRDVGFGELVRRSPQQKGGQQGQQGGQQTTTTAATAAKGNAAATVTLDAKAIQTASNLDGNQTPADGQAASLT